MTSKNKVTKAAARASAATRAKPETSTEKSGSDGTVEDAIYFWRETDPENGYLSQWYDCPFRDKDAPNKIYKTAEQ